MDTSVAFSPKELRRLQTLQSLAARSLTQAQAAAVLRTRERQVRRLSQRFRRSGPKGVLSGHRGQSSANRLSEQTRAKAVEWVADRYADFGPTFAAEKLREEHGITRGRESLRQLMIAAGLWHSKISKPRRHPTRQRRPRFGELVQIDGSPHAWFEDRGPRCTLLVFIDDATSRLLGWRFAAAELRLRAISTIDEANAFLPTFVTAYNQRFSVAPFAAEDAHRPLHQSDDLERSFSIHAKRRISKNLTVPYQGVRYQITQTTDIRRLMHAEVTLHIKRDGAFAMHWNSRPLSIERLPDVKRNGEIADRKAINVSLDAKVPVVRVPHKPAANHPWRATLQRRNPTAV